ncbi:fatty acid desaturase family protein [Sphingomonas sp. 1185]|uniref:fatty acid desaturase family protein n=1 Tax=Sphingomonas sp. 1185 TaxID=3156411 RepID=UPI003393B078
MSEFTAEHYRLPAEARTALRKLYQLDNIHGPLAVTINIAIVSMAVWSTLQISWLLYPVALLVIGSRQRAFATMMHEATHKTLARNAWLNGLLGTVFGGYLVWSTFSAYHSSHVRGHHGTFGDPALDADYAYMIERGLYEQATPREHFVALVLKPLLLTNVYSYLKYIWQFRINPTDHAAAREARYLVLYWLVIVSIASLTGHMLDLIVFWIIPFLTTFQVIGWFIELSEHGPLMENRRVIERTRNRNSHWIEAAFTAMHNEHLHLVHHLCPGIPFWNLPALHRLLLKDPDYRAWDADCGGIFLSSNGAPSAVSLIVSRSENLKATSTAPKERRA